MTADANTPNLTPEGQRLTDALDATWPGGIAGDPLWIEHLNTAAALLLTAAEPEGVGLREAERTAMARVLLIQARELQRLDPTGQTPADLDAAMDDLRATQRTALTKQPAVQEPAAAGVGGEIAAERRRQIEAEGWTPEHDDTHAGGEMALAAGCYALAAAGNPYSWLSQFWPWSRDWWRPGVPRRNLVKAGALIVAEIERLDRASAATLTPAAPKKPDAATGGLVGDGGLREAAQAYLTALDAEPEKDCWDTESGEEEPGAHKFASDWSHADYYDARDAALLNLRSALSVAPAARPGDGVSGFVLVPREPTDAMVTAGMKAADKKWMAWTGGRSPLDGMMFFVRDAYPAMIAAAPAADGGRA